ncbi:MAG: enoyl-CoA hydratase/isomerase family protein [Pseudomonadota bacterium]
MDRYDDQAEAISESVSIHQKGAVATVIFDRGDGLNALSIEVMESLLEAARRLDAMPHISAIVLHGRGVFSAGADLKDPDRAKLSELSFVEQRHAMRLGPDLCAAWERLEQITIAAIERFCIGGGVALAVGCDHRIIGQDAHMRLPEVPLGMNMSWQTNPRTVALIGPSRAKRFTILGERCEAKQALDWGLVDEICTPGSALDTAQDLAAKYAAMPAAALRMTKQAINVAAMPLGLATAYMDRDQFGYAATAEAQTAALRSFRKKEPDKGR